MAGIGNNPIPTKVGGGPSFFSKTQAAFRSAVGIGGSAVGDDTIENHWRRARSRGLSAAFSASSRAIANASPDTSTDFISEYEDLLDLLVGSGLADQERRDAVVAAWTKESLADGAALTRLLADVDPRLSFVEVAFGSEVSTLHGRTFEPRDGSEPFDAGGPRISTGVPNYSTEFVVRVFFDIGPAGTNPGEDVLRLRQEVVDKLNDALPFWMDFVVEFDADFILDQSLLDAAGFGYHP